MSKPWQAVPKSIAADKASIRQWAKTQRCELPLSEAAQAIVNHMVQWSDFQAAKTVMAYYPTDHELPFEPLFELAQHKQWFLPRVESPTTMAFYPYRLDDPLSINGHGIWEPEPSEPLDPHTTDVDMLILPALAVDTKGHRLGYGQGYYDRYLAQYPQLLMAKKVALLPTALCIKTLPVEPHDVPIGTVVTENGVIPCVSKAARKPRKT